MKIRIDSIDALEILDSRGNPTVRVNLECREDSCSRARGHGPESASGNRSVHDRTGRHGEQGQLGGQCHARHFPGRDPRRRAGVWVAAVRPSRRRWRVWGGSSPGSARACAVPCGTRLSSRRSAWKPVAGLSAFTGRWIPSGPCWVPCSAWPCWAGRRRGIGTMRSDRSAWFCGRSDPWGAGGAGLPDARRGPPALARPGPEIFLARCADCPRASSAISAW